MVHSLSVCYGFARFFGIRVPIIHVFFKIKDGKKEKSISFCANSKFLWSLSIILPVAGVVNNERYYVKEEEILTTNPRIIKKFISIIPKYDWKIYHALLRNCFDWCSAVIKEANLKPLKYNTFTASMKFLFGNPHKDKA